jgi:hypothetical protein
MVVGMLFIGRLRGSDGYCPSKKNKSIMEVEKKSN